MSRIIIHKNEADFDIIEAAYYITETSLGTSKRFTRAVHAAIASLAEMPGMGVRRDYNNPTYADMRMWPVPEFPKYLIYYRTTDEYLIIIRVLHSAQDIAAIFAPEKPEESDAEDRG